MLLILYGGLFTGNKRDLEKSEAFMSMAVTFCKRQGWLRETTVVKDEEEHRSLDERWRRWRDREELKRLGFGAVVSQPNFQLLRPWPAADVWFASPSGP